MRERSPVCILSRITRYVDIYIYSFIYSSQKATKVEKYARLLCLTDRRRSVSHKRQWNCRRYTSRALARGCFRTRVMRIKRGLVCPVASPLCTNKLSAFHRRPPPLNASSNAGAICRARTGPTARVGDSLVYGLTCRSNKDFKEAARLSFRRAPSLWTRTKTDINRIFSPGRILYLLKDHHCDYCTYYPYTRTLTLQTCN